MAPAGIPRCGERRKAVYEEMAGLSHAALHYDGGALFLSLSAAAVWASLTVHYFVRYRNISRSEFEVKWMLAWPVLSLPVGFFVYVAALINVGVGVLLTVIIVLAMCFANIEAAKGKWD